MRYKLLSRLNRYDGEMLFYGSEYIVSGILTPFVHENRSVVFLDYAERFCYYSEYLN